jgi:hypothetical protein
MAGQGVVGDATCRDLDRDVAGMGTWRDEDGDAKAWHDGDEDRGPGTRDDRENEIVLTNIQEDHQFIVTRAATAIALHLLRTDPPSSTAVSLGSDHPRDL